MRLDDLRPNRGARRKPKRKGIGIAAGQGKTSGRGMKGQNAREQVPPGFEGIRTPLYRRFKKLRGQNKGAMPIGHLRTEYAWVNVRDLQRFDAKTVVTPGLLLERRIIRKLGDGLRVLGAGEIDRALTVRAHHFSASAKAKIEAAGGTAEPIT